MNERYELAAETLVHLARLRRRGTLVAQDIVRIHGPVQSRLHAKALAGAIDVVARFDAGDEFNLLVRGCVFSVPGCDLLASAEPMHTNMPARPMPVS